MKQIKSELISNRENEMYIKLDNLDFKIDKVDGFVLCTALNFFYCYNVKTKKINGLRDNYIIELEKIYNQNK